jgi:hypothetical protein
MSRHAILVGTTRYEDPLFSQLTAPAPDVLELHAVLTASDIGGFDAMAPLLNEPAYRLNVALEEFFQDRALDDLLLFYFSGHGIVDDYGHLYLAATNTNRKHLRSTAVAASFVRDLMDQCRSEKQIMILDCCHSGAFGKAKGVIGSSVETDRVFGGNGRIVLTASNATQFAFEGNAVLGNAKTSLFTHFLLQGLRSGDADLDGDGNITVDELYSYAHDHVARTTRKQTPGKWAYRQEGDILLARSVKPRASLDPLSHEALRAIDSRDRTVQTEALQSLKELLTGSNPDCMSAARKRLSQLVSHDSRFVSEFARRALADGIEARYSASPLGRGIVQPTAPQLTPAASVHNIKAHHTDGSQQGLEPGDPGRPGKPEVRAPAPETAISGSAVSTVAVDAPPSDFGATTDVAPHSAVPFVARPLVRRRALLAAAALAVLGLFLLLPTLFSSGTLMVTVAGDSSLGVLRDLEIFIDDEDDSRCRESPCKIQGLPEGIHYVQARAAGHQSSGKILVAIVRDEIATHNVQLIRTGTGVRVVGNEPGLVLLVDGKELGPLPQDVREMEPGEHLVQVKAGPRYEVFSQPMTVEPDRMTLIGPISLKVVKGLATIRAGAGAEGAEVRLKVGDSMRVLPALPVRLEVETDRVHTLLARRKGYVPFEEQIIFPNGQAEQTIEVTLTERVGAAASTAPTGVEASKDGRLDLDSTPPSDVIIDGKPLGQTPLSLYVDPGIHRVIFVNGTERKAKTVDAASGSATSVSVRFEGSDLAAASEQRPNGPTPSAEGLATTAIQSTVRRYSPAIRQNCWQRSFNERGPGIPSSAKVTATITVNPSGSVKDVSMSEAPRGYPGLPACIGAAVHAWTFPRAAGETVANVPFMFVGD